MRGRDRIEPADELAALETNSFAELLARVAPHLLPPSTGVDSTVPELLRHGTTVVALKYTSGVVVAADRRETMGTVVTQRDVERIFGANESSVVAVAGAPGLTVELVRLFTAEIEHYEKIEGRRLSIEGRATRLASIVRSSVSLAVQGQAVSPILVGWDDLHHRSRIFSYDGTGGRYEEQVHACAGIGSMFAREALRKVRRSDLDRDHAVRAVVDAVYQASDEDAARRGPDLSRGVYPVVMVADPSGVTRLPTEEVALVAKRIVDDLNATSNHQVVRAAIPDDEEPGTDDTRPGQARAEGTGGERR